MDIARPDQSRAKKIKRIIYATVGVLFTAGVSVGVSYLRPAASLSGAVSSDRLDNPCSQA